MLTLWTPRLDIGTKERDKNSHREHDVPREFSVRRIWFQVGDFYRGGTGTSYGVKIVEPRDTTIFQTISFLLCVNIGRKLELTASFLVWMTGPNWPVISLYTNTLNKNSIASIEESAAPFSISEETRINGMDERCEVSLGLEGPTRCETRIKNTLKLITLHEQLLEGRKFVPGLRPIRMLRDFHISASIITKLQSPRVYRHRPLPPPLR